MLRFAQPDTWPLAVLVDKDDAGRLEGSAERLLCQAARLPRSTLEVNNCPKPYG